MKRITWKLVLVMLIVGCSVQAQRKSKNNDADVAANAMKIRVKPYQADSVQHTVHTFALKKTVLQAKAIVQKNSFVPGPYAEFAEKLLGAPAKQKAEDLYRIKEVSIFSFLETDWSKLYAVKAEIPVELNLATFQKYYGDFLIESNKQFKVELPLADILPTQFLDRGTEATTYDKSGAGATTPLIPVIAEKSLERRAKDAADYVLLLRKRRTELVGADVEAAYASNEAIQHALNEMKRLEDNYLALFYGVYEAPRLFPYYFVIEPELEKEEYPLGSLVSEKGFATVGTSAGRQAQALTIKITPDTRAKLSVNTNEQVLPYLVPMGCNLKVQLGNETIMAERIQLMQFGPLMYLPISMFIGL